MDLTLKTTFEKLFARYFPGAELPLTFYYADEPPAGMKAAPASKGWHCFVADLAAVRKGDRGEFPDHRAWEKVMRRLQDPAVAG